MSDHRTRVTSRARKGIDWDAQPLGEVSNKEIARVLGVTPQTVQAAGRRRGIAPFTAHTMAKGIDWAAQFALGGTDAEIARRTETSKGTVGRARKRLGLPPSTGKRGPKPRAKRNQRTKRG